MAVKKKHNIHFRTRGSNHKYPQLDDIDRLKELLRHDCPATVAKNIEVPYGSLLYVINNHFTPEEQEQVAWKRSRHQNKLIHE